MPFIQPPVTPLPAGIDLSGQTALVTGANTGIGLEISKQLLARNLSTLILAVRSPSKGEAVRAQLIAEYPSAKIELVRLDAENYSSVQEFITEVQSTFTELHILMLNAGIGTLQRELASSKHEKNLQVNYLSNVLITFGLLPLLESTSAKTGKPSRITWTGSRSLNKSDLVTGKSHLTSNQSILQHMDGREVPYERYGNSKLLVAMFLDELSQRYSPDKVIMNNFCPGMVKTTMSDVLPIYFRIPMKGMLALRGRSVETAGWIALNAAVVAGEETHGKLLGDKTIVEPNAFLKSEDGKRVQKLAWEETMAEIGTFTGLPSWVGSLL
ncbi:unnamed protein product [Clonostachys rosea]|uniref:Uncharacterized protein n=1 Tax=Bionectria ochroleuca TaxID=29856 RepID=A0ABY6UNL8_BIOOC|nr:unnamed protein product [Clonostachys rosea]